MTDIDSMSMSELYPSDWLVGDEVAEHGPFTVDIIGVKLEPFVNNGRAVDKPTLHFQQDVKPMVVNKTNAAFLFETFGKPSTWKGQRVELSSIRSKKPDGSPCNSIEIRRALPPEATAPMPPADSTEPPPPSDADSPF